eukprot:m.128564 g.128564  ORF g.128564 m.128564 type:complete len:421 (-) comp14560_c0_seq2:2179-3441(-)
MEPDVVAKFNTLRTRNSEIVAGIDRVATRAESVKSSLQCAKEAIQNLADKRYSRITSPRTPSHRSPHSDYRHVITPATEKGNLEKNVREDSPETIRNLIHKYDDNNINYSEFYELLEELGRGESDAVFKVKHRKSGKIFAIKHIDLRKMSADRVQILLKEIEQLKSLDHTNIIKIYEYYKGTNDIFLVLEFCSGGDLLKLLNNVEVTPCGHQSPSKVQRIQEAQARKIITEMLQAVTYLSHQGVRCRDMKLEKFLYSGPGEGSGTLKFIDFGLGHVTYSSSKRNVLVYKAPEAVNGNASNKSDVWSFGILCHMLVTGLYPFEGNSLQEVEENLQRETSSPEAWSQFLRWFYSTMQLSDACADFLIKMLIVSPVARPGFNELCRHPWVIGDEHAMEKLSAEYRKQAPLQFPQRVFHFQRPS